MYNSKKLESAYVSDFWDRDSVKDYNSLIVHFLRRIGEVDINGIEFTEDGYKKIAKVADRLIVEAIQARMRRDELKELEGEEIKDRDPQDVYAATDKPNPQRAVVEPANKNIRDYQIDDMIEILVSIKNVAKYSDFAELEQRKKETDQEENEIIEKEPFLIRLATGMDYIINGGRASWKPC